MSAVSSTSSFFSRFCSIKVLLGSSTSKPGAAIVCKCSVISRVAQTLQTLDCTDLVTGSCTSFATRKCGLQLGTKRNCIYSTFSEVRNASLFMKTVSQLYILDEYATLRRGRLASRP